MTWQINIWMLLSLIAGLTGIYALGYSNGADNVQDKWDIEKAKIQSVADAEKARNLKTVADLNDKHKKEIEHAKSESGRAAVNRWLREHGMLPSGITVRGCGSPSSADSSKVPDAGREEQGTSGGIDGFAINCADDASRLTDWQTLCKSQGCFVE